MKRPISLRGNVPRAAGEHKEHVFFVFFVVSEIRPMQESSAFCSPCSISCYLQIFVHSTLLSFSCAFATCTCLPNSKLHANSSYINEYSKCPRAPNRVFFPFFQEDFSCRLVMGNELFSSFYLYRYRGICSMTRLY